MGLLKKSVVLISVILFVLSISLFMVGCQKKTEEVEEKVYINGIDANFPPFAYIDEEGNPAGFDVDSVDWIAEEMGFEVKHQPTAWDGIVESLLAGKIDFVASGMSITPEREKVISFTIPYWQTDLGVAVREDSSLDYDNIMSGEYKIGVQRGTTAADWVEGNMIAEGILEENMMVMYDSFSLALKDLTNGRVDAAMQDVTMVADAAKSQPIKIVGTLDAVDAYGYGVRQEDNELREMLDEGIRRLQESDYWDELKAKYEM